MTSTDESDIEEGMLDFFKRSIAAIPEPRDWGKVTVEEHGFETKGFPDSRNVRQTSYQGQQVLSPPVPTVTDIVPAVGEPTGGTAVTITGTNFFDDTINGGVKSSVKIGDSPCTSVVVVNHTTITCVTGRHPPSGTVTEGTFDVVVYNVEPTMSPPRPGIFGTLTNGFVYEFAPTVSAISPNTGDLTGGTSVTVTGTHFRTGATVKIGGVSCTSVVFVNSISITCTTGAHVAGAVDVVVTNPSGLVGTGINLYNYAVPFPASFTLSGPATPQLGPYYTYVLTANNAYTGNVDFGYDDAYINHPDNSGGVVVRTISYGTCIPYRTDLIGNGNGVHSTKIGLPIANGHLSLLLRFEPRIVSPPNYGLGDYGQGYVRLQLYNPSGGAIVIVNGGSDVTLSFL